MQQTVHCSDLLIVSIAENFKNLCSLLTKTFWKEINHWSEWIWCPADQGSLVCPQVHESWDGTPVAWRQCGYPRQHIPIISAPAAHFQPSHALCSGEAPSWIFVHGWALKGISSTCLPGKYSTEGPVLINCNGRRKGRELLSHHGCWEDALEKATNTVWMLPGRGDCLRILFTVRKTLSLSKTKQISPFSLQGRHVKTGQLAAIKVMDVTGVMYPPPPPASLNYR